MSANAESVGFKLACNVHVWAYFEKLPDSRKTYFLQKMAYGLEQDIYCIQFLVVSDLDALFKRFRRSGYSGLFWIAFKWGLNLGGGGRGV